jgi:flagellin-like hook-associated protein FlgL
VGLHDASDSAATGLKFKATDYGSASFVSVKSLTNPFTVKNSDGVITDRTAGTDVSVQVNGVMGVGIGLKASINTATLDLNLSLASTLTNGTSYAFRITGGGAQFQLGPDVVSNQQARLGITSMNTSKLGSSAGRLYELRSGEAKSLTGDVMGAASVVDDSIKQVTTIRGRLGAFQKTTLDTNIATLSDTLEALTDAESSIRDADFAAESANMTKAQILVQAGTSVLSIANSRPQSVLSLLRG